MMRWFWDKYLADPSRRARAMRRRCAPRNLANLPPGLCITAGYDPLRDEGEAYAELLRKAGVDVRTSRYPGMFHGFLSHDRPARPGAQSGRGGGRRAPRRRWPRPCLPRRP
jgi:acetyl esterase/lipase